jgi:hypothetical protein
MAHENVQQTAVASLRRAIEEVTSGQPGIALRYALQAAQGLSTVVVLEGPQCEPEPEPRWVNARRAFRWMKGHPGVIVNDSRYRLWMCNGGEIMRYDCDHWKRMTFESVAGLLFLVYD